MSTTETVERYFALAARDDVEAFVGLFDDDAVVVDDGRELRGRDDLRAWRRGVPAVTFTVARVVPADDGATADVGVAGDFPGSPVDLRFAFGIDTRDRITTLTIQPVVTG